MKKLYAIITFCLFCGYPLFSQTISSNAPLCGNANLTLELIATGGSTYAWTGPNGFTSTLQKPTIKNVNWKNRGVYTVIIDGKTTLTTDVNIKDPVAFTVPKEISVCEGGTLLIEPKSSRLTDSTEVLNYSYIYNASGKLILDGVIESFSSKDVGLYTITGQGVGIYSCPTTKSLNVKINSNCKTIEIEDLSQKSFCKGQDISIPFTLKGDFKKGTKFKIYAIDVNDYFPSNKQPNTITEQSPAIFKLTNGFASFMRIVIIADDTEKTFVISKPTTYPYSGTNNNYIEINNKFCDSVSLKVVNNLKLNSLQWFLDDKEIKNVTSSLFTSKVSGNYTLKFKDNINSSCLYESQPVKIELGKIEKPSAYISNNIELCVGKPATLSVSTNTNTTYRWKKDGNYIANAAKSTFEILQEGKYQVEAKEGNCTAISDTVVLSKPKQLNEVYLYPLNSSNSFIDYSGAGDKRYKICDNQNYGLYVALGRYNFTSLPKIQWIKNGNLLKDSLSSIASIKGEGSYYVKASYGTCMGLSDNLTIQYSKTLKGSTYTGYGNTIEQCLGTSLNLQISSSSSDNKLSQGSIYKDGAFFKDWTIKNSSQSYSYYDYFPLNQSGKYYAMGKVTFPDNSECNIVTDTVTVNFTKKLQEKPFTYIPDIQAVPITSCKDTIEIGSYHYSQSGREITYKWTKDGVTIRQDSSGTLTITQSGIYQLETSYKGTCTVVTAPYKVELGKNKVNFKSFESVLSPSGSVCDGSIYYLYPYAQESRVGNIYNLYKDGQQVNNSLLGIISINQAGIYKVVVKDGKCEGTSPDFVLKVDKISTTITPTDSVTFCAGKTVDLKASTEAGLSYIWERNGTIISQANQATLTASTDGLYKATLLRGVCWATTPSVKLKSLANIIPTATITGDQKIGLDQETKLSVNLTSHAPWTFKLSDGKEYNATKSPFEITVKPLTTTTYSLAEVNNICGTGTVSGTAKIEVIILSTEEEKELSVEVFPMPSSEICHWKMETPQISSASVVLYDGLGIEQFSSLSPTRSQTHQGTIDLTNLKAGTYFLKLQAGEKNVTRKVIKL